MFEPIDGLNDFSTHGDTHALEACCNVELKRETQLMRNATPTPYPYLKCKAVGVIRMFIDVLCSVDRKGLEDQQGHLSISIELVEVPDYNI